MGIIGWILIGLIMGAIARAIVPGQQKGGWIVTLILGVLGALLGGFIARGVFGTDANEEFFDLGTWGFALLGSLIVVFVWSWITSRKRT
ncbi:GlsB/YeaQ/YmgE family stress response membrane protein [Cellulosimicrobium marinum]|uniref:GlsB/YeaQ/YmgE family stress response membrane protein n=1 Tax=Cellulosimicrobium marinum TaxID=1638992 RepID=UPI001E543387|nr:GlsB/YeaQ/YmgE family stress response membrane protein [Cellulosimicrobium marinum]MCB7136133.1 GlsB/YeaQ/YmgE family stress response membrane protein [Cellulosimicrobium marinum]